MNARSKPSVDEICATLDRAGQQLLKTANDAATAVRELREGTGLFGGLKALADAWDDRAAQFEDEGDQTGQTMASTLRMCAQQLRDAVTKGAQS